MIGVKGYAPNHAFVIRDESEVANLPKLRSPLVVSQTTIKAKTFFDTAEAVKLKTDDGVEVVNTICSATRDRQDAARALAGMVDAFYIIGGRHSSNSVKLLAVCKEQCEKSFLIETEDEIDASDIAGANRVGVTAGASTPEWLIQRIVKHLEDLGKTERACTRSNSRRTMFANKKRPSIGWPFLFAIDRVLRIHFRKPRQRDRLIQDHTELGSRSNFGLFAFRHTLAEQTRHRHR